MKRPLNPMPDEIAAILDARGLRAAYDARPPYQQNDWLGWVSRAKQPETRARRLQSMLDELAAGRGYMGMDWQPRGAKRGGA